MTEYAVLSSSGRNPAVDPQLTRLIQGPILPGPVLFEATGSRRYPPVESCDDGLGDHAGSNQLALDYAHAITPSSRLSVLSHGLTSVVLEDGDGLVFKVFRSMRR